MEIPADASLGRRSSMSLRNRLKRIPIAFRIARFLKTAALAIRYYFPRIIARALFPILGGRVPLRGFYWKTKDFLKGGGGEYIELESSSSQGPASPGHQHIPIQFVAIIPQGRAIYRSGAVIAPDHKLLADVSWQEWFGKEPQPTFHPAMRTMCLPRVERIRGSVAVLSSALTNCYYHWLFDVLPRIGILRTSGRNPDFYFVNTEMLHQREGLTLLNIPQAKVIDPAQHIHIQADELIVPSLPGPPYIQSPQDTACKFLRSAFLSEDRKSVPHRLLYISRSDAHERRVINESEVRELILPLGFEVLTLSGMPFGKQVQLFSEALVVLGPHGAGFSNAVFCQPDSTLIEFLPKSRSGDSCFERLAELTRIQYYALNGADDPARSASDITEDYTVDITELRQTVRRVLEIA